MKKVAPFPKNRHKLLYLHPSKFLHDGKIWDANKNSNQRINSERFVATHKPKLKKKFDDNFEPFYNFIEKINPSG